MGKKGNIFTEEIEMPEIVLQKVEDAFIKIRKESIKETEIRRKNKRRIFKSQVAVATCVCVLAVGSITVAATVSYLWGRGMKETMQATEKQQQELEEQGVASGTNAYEDLAVSSGGIIVTPTETIVDGKCAYLSFSVEGYQLEEGMSPCFEAVNAYIGEDFENVDEFVGMSGAFYDGIVPDENNTPVYADGTPVRYDEDGSVISHYVNEQGAYEFIMIITTSDLDVSLIGEELHVQFTNFGAESGKAKFTNLVEGNWNFDIRLPGKSAVKAYQIGTVVNRTRFQLDFVEISPISITANYSVIEKDKGKNHDIPELTGVILKDGTKLPYSVGEGLRGYRDKSMTKAYTIGVFDRLIEVENVKAVLIRNGDGDFVTVDIK